MLPGEFNLGSYRFNVINKLYEDETGFIDFLKN
jgi:hypothetical protein